MTNDDRPDPERLLQALKNDEAKKHVGKLRLFFGMSAGVGKTYAMLTAAQELRAAGVDVIVGVVETHGRSETEALLHGLAVIPKKAIDYKGTQLSEFDLDAVIARKPAYVLVDELAHSNAPGSRHPKRYQDVLELLDQGINVFSTLNIQHLDSLNDVVRRITGVTVRETVPDSLLQRADEISLIDISPDQLLMRLREGKVYLGDRKLAAAENFFKEESLTALRELLLRATAERVENQLQDLRQNLIISGRWNTVERLLVAVSHSPFSEDLIRATKRHAAAMRAPWIVLNVDTGSAHTEIDAEQLRKNLRLAQELGAEVVTTAAHNVVAAIARIARERDITQIIVGRPDRRFWRDIFQGGTILDRLVRLKLDIDVHVIRPHIEGSDALRKPASMAPRIETVPILTALAIVACASILSWFLEPLLGYRAVGFVYLLAILLLAFRSSFSAMLVAAGLSAFAWNYFFIPPRFTFIITEPEDFMMFAAYFVAASIAGLLTTRTIKQERLLRQREMRTQVLFDFVRALVELEGIENLAREIDRRTQRLFQARSCLLVPDNKYRNLGRVDCDKAIEMDTNDWAVAAWVFENQKAAGWSTETLSQVRSLCLPLQISDETIGVFLFRPIEPTKLSHEQSDLLIAFCHQTAVALQRELLQIQNRELALLEESEKLHQTLLNSISHELRTPLTAIIGFAAALRDPKLQSNADNRESLAGEIVASADRLNHVIENLLDMSRLQSGSLHLNLEWFDVEDLIGETIKQSHSLLRDRKVKVSAGQQPVLLRGDYGLLLHALSNLLRNAALYSPAGTGIDITVGTTNDQMSIAVADRGPGIPPEELKNIFEKFRRLPQSPAGGIGLGLSLSKSIVELHKGHIRAASRNGGGAEFTIELPITERPTALSGEAQK